MNAVAKAMRELHHLDRPVVECQWRKDVARRGDELALSFLVACEIDLAQPCSYCREDQRRHTLPGQKAARLLKRRKEQFGPQADLCRQLPCCACGAKPPSEPDHVRSRGAGGTDEDTVPMCRTCHDLRHAFGHIQLSIMRNLPVGVSYFTHVAEGLRAVLSISMGLAIDRGEQIDRGIARAVYGSFA